MPSDFSGYSRPLVVRAANVHSVAQSRLTGLKGKDTAMISEIREITGAT